MNADLLLSVRGLHCGYGAAMVLRGIDFSVARGEVVGLVGPNGAGKSTLLKCLAGIAPSRSGRIALDGRALASYRRRELARVVACVPQHSGSTMALRVIDMVALGRSPHRGTAAGATDREQVLGAIDALQLQGLAMRFFGELSGGERQRVLMARALAQQGRLMLLDEPTSDLDLRHQLAALGSVRALADERGVAAIIAIHDLALAARFCDRLLLLHAGRVHAQGPWQEVLTPAHLRTVYGVEARIGSEQGVPWVSATAMASSRAAA